MTVAQSLKRRSGVLVGGLGSFLVALALFRWWGGEPIVQPSGDFGIVIGAALVALYFVMSDMRAPSAGAKARAQELR
jgi:hypothetical protein